MAYMNARHATTNKPTSIATLADKRETTHHRQYTIHPTANLGQYSTNHPWQVVGKHKIHNREIAERGRAKCMRPVIASTPMTT